jgi:hypothetical protein
MHDCVSDTVGGFNSFVEEQKKTGDCTLTLIQFDTQYEVNFEGVDIQKIKPMVAGRDYQPRGGTALLDAVGTAISSVQARLGETGGGHAMVEERPKVIFVIMTDGEENSSREFNYDQVKTLIEKKRKEDDWQVVFMGAEIDAERVGGSFGVHKNHTMSYGKKHSRRAFGQMSRGVTNYKASGMRGMSCDTNFFEDEDGGKMTVDNKVEVEKPADAGSRSEA